MPPADASGRLLLRLPKSMHGEVLERAAQEGVSVNQLIVAAIARELGRREPKAPGRRRKESTGPPE
jgi:predicted HicB family RNase H-like nuclease